MPTLIQMVLNTRHRAVHRDLQDVHALHQRVMSLLPDGLGDDARERTGTLFRLEDSPSGPRLLVQCDAEVTYARLPEGYCQKIRSLDLSPLMERLAEGARVRYSITANPSKRSAVGDMIGKRIALVGYDAIYEWWHRRAEAAGLDIIRQPVEIEPVPAAVGKRRSTDGRENQKITHRAHRIDGLATVVDAELLKSAISKGVGPGKAHGLGLLSVVPAKVSD